MRKIYRHKFFDIPPGAPNAEIIDDSLSPQWTNLSRLKYDKKKTGFHVGKPEQGWEVIGEDEEVIVFISMPTQHTTSLLLISLN